MGGTRFVGKSLVAKLLDRGHLITLFTRGRNSVPNNVEHLKGDRFNDEALSQLKGRTFDVIIDSSGRKLEDTKRVLPFTGCPKHRFLYLSSAGVYLHSDEIPVSEESPVDKMSRHIGKAETEDWLNQEGIPFTSFRPTYIYGPGNYNQIERWFFDRIIHSRPVPLPGDGKTITQLGHVDDLAEAMVKSLEIDKATNRIYNCSAKKGITFDGLVSAAALACGKDPKLVVRKYFDPAGLDPKARKSFPLRIEHFFTDITRAENELNWEPKYNLQNGLSNSFKKDYELAPTLSPNFSSDSDLIIP